MSLGQLKNDQELMYDGNELVHDGIEELLDGNDQLPDHLPEVGTLYLTFTFCFCCWSEM